MNRGGNEAIVSEKARPTRVRPWPSPMRKREVIDCRLTGSHYAWTDDEIGRGSLVTLTGDNRKHLELPDGEIIYGIVPSTEPNDPRCMGAYLTKITSDEGNADPPHLVMSVGNGDMWVVDNGKKIEPGDYLISSDVTGHAMLDDPERFPIGYVVARVGEPVNWSGVTETIDGRKHKKISVFFESFVRGDAALAKVVHAQQQQIEVLLRDNSDLQSRLSTLEQSVVKKSSSTSASALAMATPVLAALCLVGFLAMGRKRHGGAK